MRPSARKSRNHGPMVPPCPRLPGRSLWPARKDGHVLGENQCRNTSLGPEAPRYRSGKAASSRRPVRSRFHCPAILHGPPGQAIASALASLHACHPRPVNAHWGPTGEAGRAAGRRHREVLGLPGGGDARALRASRSWVPGGRPAYRQRVIFRPGNARLSLLTPAFVTRV